MATRKKKIEDNDLLDELFELARSNPAQWPDSARKRIDRALAHTTDEICLSGIYLCLEEMEDRLANRLLSITTSDRDLKLRIEAVGVLGTVLEEFHLMFDYEDPDSATSITMRMFDKIQRALKFTFYDANTPKMLRCRILESSVQAEQAWHSKAISDAYRSDDRDWRITAIFCMGFVDGFDETIIKHLQDEDPESLREAVRAAGNMVIIEAADRIMEIAGDENTDEKMRQEAIWAIGQIVPTNAESLLDELAKSKNEVISDAAKMAQKDIEYFYEQAEEYLFGEDPDVDLDEEE
jgi:HEAT repeats